MIYILHSCRDFGTYFPPFQATPGFSSFQFVLKINMQRLENLLGLVNPSLSTLCPFLLQSKVMISLLNYEAENAEMKKVHL